MYKWAADNQSQGLMGNILFSCHFSFALLPVIWLKWCMKVHKYTRAGLQSPPQHILAPSQITFDAVTILRFIHAEFHFRDQWTMSLSILLSVYLSTCTLQPAMWRALLYRIRVLIHFPQCLCFCLVAQGPLPREWLLWDIDRRCWSGSLRSANLLILCETRTWCVLHYNWGELLFGPLTFHFWTLTFMGGLDKMTHLDEFIIN